MIFFVSVSSVSASSMKKVALLSASVREIPAGDNDADSTGLFAVKDINSASRVLPLLFV